MFGNKLALRSFVANMLNNGVRVDEIERLVVERQVERTGTHVGSPTDCGMVEAGRGNGESRGEQATLDHVFELLRGLLVASVGKPSPPGDAHQQNSVYTPLTGEVDRKFTLPAPAVKAMGYGHVPAG